MTRCIALVVLPLLALAGLAYLATKPAAAYLVRGLDVEGDGDA